LSCQAKAREERAQRGTCSVEEAAIILGISRGLAYKAVRASQIPALRLSHRWVVPLVAPETMLTNVGNQEGGR
jgi:hypothetical protein